MHTVRRTLLGLLHFAVDRGHRTPGFIEFPRVSLPVVIIAVRLHTSPSNGSKWALICPTRCQQKQIEKPNLNSLLLALHQSGCQASRLCHTLCDVNCEISKTRHMSACGHARKIHKHSLDGGRTGISSPVSSSEYQAPGAWLYVVWKMFISKGMMEVGSASGESASPENEAPLSLILCLPAQVRYFSKQKVDIFFLRNWTPATSMEPGCPRYVATIQPDPII
eukprot:scaffold25778_cov78-Cyclotella_meneghiniana.AAC.10